jgi:hypothetical protein
VKLTADNITPPSQISPQDVFGSDEEEEPFKEQEPIGQEPEEEEPEGEGNETDINIDDLIEGINEMKVAKDPSLSMKSVFTFKII